MKNIPFLKHFYFLILLLPLSSLGQEFLKDTYIIYNGTGEANGGTYTYNATIKARMSHPTRIQFSITSYELTDFQYKGELASDNGFSFPIIINNHQADLIFTLDVHEKVGLFPYLQDKKILGVRQGALDFYDLTEEDKSKGFGVKTIDDLYSITIKNAELINTYFEELSSIKSQMEKNWKEEKELKEAFEKEKKRKEEKEALEYQNSVDSLNVIANRQKAKKTQEEKEKLEKKEKEEIRKKTEENNQRLKEHNQQEENAQKQRKQEALNQENQKEKLEQQRRRKNQKKVRDYNQQVAEQKDRNVKQSHALAAENLSAMAAIGFVMYKDMGKVSSKNTYFGNQFYYGIDMGYSLPIFPIVFNHEKKTLVYNANTGDAEYKTIKKDEEEILMPISISFKPFIGYESKYVGGELYGHFQPGASIIYTSYNLSYDYGGNIYAGLPWIKGFYQYTRGVRSFYANDWMDPEEYGNGKSKYKYSNSILGVKFSFSNKRKRYYSRHHFTFGRIYESIIEGVVKDGETFRAYGGELTTSNLPFLNNKYGGWYFEWVKEHNFSAYIKYYPNYPSSGLRKNPGGLPDQYFLEMGFIRQIKKFINIDYNGKKNTTKRPRTKLSKYDIDDELVGISYSPIGGYGALALTYEKFIAPFGFYIGGEATYTFTYNEKYEIDENSNARDLASKYTSISKYLLEIQDPPYSVNQVEFIDQDKIGYKSFSGVAGINFPINGTFWLYLGAGYGYGTTLRKFMITETYTHIYDGTNVNQEESYLADRSISSHIFSFEYGLKVRVSDGIYIKAGARSYPKKTSISVGLFTPF